MGLWCCVKWTKLQRGYRRHFHSYLRIDNPPKRTKHSNILFLSFHFSIMFKREISSAHWAIIDFILLLSFIKKRDRIVVNVPLNSALSYKKGSTELYRKRDSIEVKMIINVWVFYLSTVRECNSDECYFSVQLTGLNAVEKFAILKAAENPPERKLKRTSNRVTLKNVQKDIIKLDYSVAFKET